MAGQSKTVSQLPIANAVAKTDRILVLTSPSSVANVKTVSIETLASNLVLSNTVPANSSSNGITGTICYDNSYIYICVSNNTWKRSAISTW